MARSPGLAGLRVDDEVEAALTGGSVRDRLLPVLPDTVLVKDDGSMRAKGTPMGCLRSLRAHLALALPQVLAGRAPQLARLCFSDTANFTFR